MMIDDDDDDDGSSYFSSNNQLLCLINTFLEGCLRISVTIYAEIY